MSADGRELVSASDAFDVSHRTDIPRPWYYSRIIPEAADPASDLIVGTQLLNSGRAAEARIYLERTYQRKPDSEDAALALAQAYLSLGETSKIPLLLTPFLAATKAPKYEVFVLAGQDYGKLGRICQGVSVLDQAVTRFGVNAVLLNEIGENYARLGQTREALAAFDKSLQLNPKQPEIQKKAAALREIKMSPRLRADRGLDPRRGVLAGAACRWYNLERKLDPANADFLTKVGYIISSAERHAFLLSPDAEKPKFIEGFWERRNPDPSSGENAFKIEYFKRIEQASRMFPSEGRPGWTTDRGRILILFGPPTDRDIQPLNASTRCQEIWYYGDFPVIFIDDTGTGTFRLASSDFGSLREISLMYMHDLELSPERGAKPRPAEKTAAQGASSSRLPWRSGPHAGPDRGPRGGGDAPTNASG